MIEITRWTPHKSLYLLGFADIYLTDVGIEINGLKYYTNNGKFWASFPSKEYEEDGEKKHSYIVDVREETKRKSFLDEVVKAIQEKFPETLETESCGSWEEVDSASYLIQASTGK